MFKFLSILIESIITGLFKARREQKEYDDVATEVPKDTTGRVDKLRDDVRKRLSK